ncbi:MAG: hypothetical protein K0R03_2678 [Moraxellaceae bacterium]|jgi:hypothetical protein|nr:hypothetical protein [Moraxellaceae bacterium]
MSKITKALSNPAAALSELLRRAGVRSVLYRDWARREFAAPSPHFIKQQVLLRNRLPNATWVETGTYMGDTTHVLSGVAQMVYSIEPEPKLFARADQRFRGTANVKILNGTSESVFPELIPKLAGDVCFWLDGHYSAGLTFKGAQDTPIVDELKVIGENLAKMNRAVVLVDDIRCFNPALPEYSTYPSLDFLVDWARQHKLSWHIEHDIFVASKA